MRKEMRREEKHMYRVCLYHNKKMIGEADGFSTAKAARDQAELWRNAEIGLMIESASIAPDDNVDDEFDIVVEKEETK